MAFNKFFETYSNLADNQAILSDFKKFVEEWNLNDLPLEDFINFCKEFDFHGSLTVEFALKHALIVRAGRKGLQLSLYKAIHELVQKYSLEKITLYEFFLLIKPDLKKTTKPEAVEFLGKLKDPSFLIALEHFRKLHGEKQLKSFLQENWSDAKLISIVYGGVASFRDSSIIKVKDLVDLFLSILNKRYGLEVVVSTRKGYEIRARNFKNVGYDRLMKLYELIMSSIET